MSSSSRNALAGSFPCVLRAICLEIHDLEPEQTLSQARKDGRKDGRTGLYGVI